MSDTRIEWADAVWTHRYVWGNNAVRARLKGQRCRIIAAGARSTVMIEAEDGARVTTSRRAIRRLRVS